MTTDAQLPPLPLHPDCHVMQWSESEKRAIERYARAAIAAHCAQREVVEWPRGSAELHRSLLAMGKEMAKERAREVGDAWNQLADLLHLLAEARLSSPSAPPTEEAEQAAMYRWLRDIGVVYSGRNTIAGEVHGVIWASFPVASWNGWGASCLDDAIRSAMSAARTPPKATA